MAEIVNLRLARKRKVRAEGERLAETNRLLHGRTRAERQRDKIEAERTSAKLEAHRRDGQ